MAITNKALIHQLNTKFGVHVHAKTSPQLAQYPGRGPRLAPKAIRAYLQAMIRVLSDLQSRFGLSLHGLDMHLLMHDADHAGASALAWFPSDHRHPAISVSNLLFDTEYLRSEMRRINARYRAGNVKLYAGTCLASRKRIAKRIHEYQDAILRHEIGHILTSTKDKIKFRQQFPKEFGQKKIMELVSTYAGTNVYEGIAELFSKITDPTYTNELAKYEPIVHGMLNRYKAI